jgi:hypothetical protein
MGTWGLISLIYSVELIIVLIIVPIIEWIYLNAVVLNAEFILYFVK